MRHGVPEIKIEIAYFVHILVQASLAKFYYSKRQVFYSK